MYNIVVYICIYLYIISNARDTRRASNQISYKNNNNKLYQKEERTINLKQATVTVFICICVRRHRRIGFSYKNKGTKSKANRKYISRICKEKKKEKKKREEKKERREKKKQKGGNKGVRGARKILYTDIHIYRRAVCLSLFHRRLKGITANRNNRKAYTRTRVYAPCSDHRRAKNNWKGSHRLSLRFAPRKKVKANERVSSDLSYSHVHTRARTHSRRHSAQTIKRSCSTTRLSFSPSHSRHFLLSTNGVGLGGGFGGSKGN